MPKIVRWICSGVQACMSCLKPPLEEGIPKMQKRKRRHFWMVRKRNKVGPESRKEKSKASKETKDDQKALPAKPKSEKAQKPKKNPPCEGCKPHSPRNIKARLGQKLKSAKKGEMEVEGEIKDMMIEDGDMKVKDDDGDRKVEVGDGDIKVEAEDDKSQEEKIAAYVASIVASAVKVVVNANGADELRDLKIVDLNDDTEADFTSNPDDASSVVSGDAKKGRESLVDALISDLAAEYVGHGENFASETSKSEVHDDQAVMTKSQNAQARESGDPTQEDCTAPLPMSPLVGERPGEFRALRNKPPRSPKRHSSKVNAVGHTYDILIL